jgi:hypothetical protein
MWAQVYTCVESITCAGDAIIDSSGQSHSWMTHAAPGVQNIAVCVRSCKPDSLLWLATATLISFLHACEHILDAAVFLCRVPGKR